MLSGSRAKKIKMGILVTCQNANRIACRCPRALLGRSLFLLRLSLARLNLSNRFADGNASVGERLVVEIGNDAKIVDHLFFGDAISLFDLDGVALGRFGPKKRIVQRHVVTNVHFAAAHRAMARLFSGRTLRAGSCS